jgi:hypothetical protein
MSQLVIDASLPEKLLRLAEPAELVDTDGKLVGRFLPEVDLKTYRLPVSEDELRRREQPGRKKHTPEEVLERLRRLP